MLPAISVGDYATGSVGPESDDAGDALVRGLQGCLENPQASARLACFDQLARDNAPPTFSGKLGHRTPLFKLDEATRLRYRSQGVIFVLYVLNERDEVVQNLHLGGGGEGHYELEPGRYSLQIDGSARWQIWLETTALTDAVAGGDL